MYPHIMKLLLPLSPPENSWQIQKAPVRAGDSHGGWWIWQHLCGHNKRRSGSIRAASTCQLFDVTVGSHAALLRQSLRAQAHSRPLEDWSHYFFLLKIHLHRIRRWITRPTGTPSRRWRRRRSLFFPCCSKVRCLFCQHCEIFLSR